MLDTVYQLLDSAAGVEAGVGKQIVEEAEAKVARVGTADRGLDARASSPAMGLANGLGTGKAKAAAKTQDRSRRNHQADVLRCRRFDRHIRSLQGCHCCRTCHRHCRTGWSRSTRIHCRSHFCHSCPIMVYSCFAVLMLWGTWRPATRGGRGPQCGLGKCLVFKCFDWRALVYR